MRIAEAMPGDADVLGSARTFPSLAGDGQPWTVFATFPDAGSEIVLFNEANRLSLSTIPSFPQALASLDLSGFVLDIDVVDLGNRRLALVAMGREGIAVVDVSLAAQPRLVAEMRGRYMAEGLSFAATGAEEVLPAAPAAILSLASDGSTLWVLDADYGLQSIALDGLGVLR
jgi:hypothetical protein